MKEIEVKKGKGWLKGNKILSGWEIEEYPTEQDIFPVGEISHYFNFSEKGGWKNKKEVAIGCSDSGVLTILTNLDPSEIKVGGNGVAQVGKLEEVEEERIETVVGEEDLDGVLKKLREAHPYEEPVIDVYELK